MKKVLFTYISTIFLFIFLTSNNFTAASGALRQRIGIAAQQATRRAATAPQASWLSRWWYGGGTPTVPAVNVPAAGYSTYSRFQPTTTPEEPTRQVQSAESTPVQSQPAQPETWQSRAWSLPQQSPSMMRQPATTPVRPNSPSQTGWFGGWFGGSSQPRQPIGARQPFETKRSGFHSMRSPAMQPSVSGTPRTSVRLGQGDFPLDRSFSTIPRSPQQLSAAEIKNIIEIKEFLMPLIQKSPGSAGELVSKLENNFTNPNKHPLNSAEIKKLRLQLTQYLTFLLNKENPPMIAPQTLLKMQTLLLRTITSLDVDEGALFNAGYPVQSGARNLTEQTEMAKELAKAKAEYDNKMRAKEGEEAEAAEKAETRGWHTRAETPEEETARRQARAKAEEDWKRHKEEVDAKAWEAILKTEDPEAISDMASAWYEWKAAKAAREQRAKEAAGRKASAQEESVYEQAIWSQHDPELMSELVETHLDAEARKYIELGIKKAVSDARRQGRRITEEQINQLRKRVLRHTNEIKEIKEALMQGREMPPIDWTL